MKTIIAFVLMLAMVGGAFAVASPMDTLCADKGYDYGVADYSRGTGNSITWTKTEGNSNFTTTVVGNKNNANWTAAPAVDGVIVNGAVNMTGGSTGKIEKNGVGGIGSDINRVTLCANVPPPVDVPEFGMIAAGLVLVAGIGLIVMRRK